MANNLFANTPAAVVSRATISFVTAGITSVNTAIIYEVGSPLKSYIPGRLINLLTGFVAGKGYYIIPLLDLDLSAILIPPVPADVMPEAPTDGVVDDEVNTFDWTNNPAYTSLTDYEYTVNGGTSYSQLTAKPLEIGAIFKLIGQIGVRIKAVSGRSASETLFNATAFVEPFPTQPKSLWLDAAINVEKSGSNITVWNDLSGNDQDAVPFTGATGSNGVAYVRPVQDLADADFGAAMLMVTGSLFVIDHTDGSPQFQNSNHYYVFLVMKPVVTGSAGGVSFSNRLVNAVGTWYTFANNNVLTIGSPFDAYTGTPANSLAKAVITLEVKNGQYIKLYYNGVLVSTSTAVNPQLINVSSNKVFLGGWYASSIGIMETGQFKLAEVIVYDNVVNPISATDFSNIVGNLKNKYSIA